VKVNKVQGEYRERLVKTQTNRRCAMSLVSLIIVLIVVGVLLYLVNTYIPMDGKIKTIINVVVVIVVVLWLLSVFGVIGSIDQIRVGRAR
jgi:O-antigen/teichoic acid export membrane protein